MPRQRKSSSKPRRPKLTREERLELLNAPWSLHFDREGTEDVAVIVDSQGDDLATSRQFWRPTGNDPMPPTLAGIHLMLAAPEMLMALFALLSEDGPVSLARHRHPAVRNARTIILKALGEGERS